MYDGRVKTNRSWWQFWKPEYDPDKWRCEFCGVVYNPWTHNALHQYGACQR